MPDSLIVEIDAAARRLVAFVGDLARYASSGEERAARRALCSPYSGVPNVDARALCIAAGERRSVADAIVRDRIPLAHESTLAAGRFVRALEDLGRAFRAQGATAREHVATVALGFDLEARLDARERAALAACGAVATDLDARRPAGVAWETEPFVRALETLAASARGGAHEVRRERLARREPEPARVVRRRKGHFSASSLGTFAECERRWYYRYVCAAVEDRGSSASFYGTAFHWALERFHEEFPRADAAPLEVLERKLEAYLGTAFERFRAGFETNVEFELQRRRAKRTSRRYLAWFVERARAHPFTVIGTETSVELDLDGYSFIGYIDRLDRDDATAGVTVVDYKTGSIAESADRYREKVANFLDFQLPFYYWARTAAGDRVTRLSLIPLKDASRDVLPIELEVVPVAPPRGYGDRPAGTIGIGELERARTKMVEIARDLTDGPIERFPVTDDADACVYCSYRLACRERPARSEDRFGR
ncbi:MAG: PD-(D/E)XK nuclease family protein [Candidatus Eremiobacteraeota bacterium]|nr:PD-(D/E)XK nuclease family protein [Candidatus Eremiobacteraeota bacterium]